MVRVHVWQPFRSFYILDPFTAIFTLGKYFTKSFIFCVPLIHLYGEDKRVDDEEQSLEPYGSSFLQREELELEL